MIDGVSACIAAELVLIFLRKRNYEVRERTVIQKGEVVNVVAVARENVERSR